MKRARIVIGANFGDEGKGLITDFLCSQGAGIVVRFNGGANAGHTVVTPDKERHVFRHFGSGTFCNVPTYLSQFFICNPILFFEERAQLIELGFHPEVYAHPDCLVTTFADMMINQIKEDSRDTKRHGSCGVGIHETQQRSKIPELKITMADLWNGSPRLQEQMDEICDKYARFRVKQAFDEPKWKESFIECCREFASQVNPLGIAQCEDPVFEGAQGLLLDQSNKQFFPHVTHSNTGLKNVKVLCDQAGIEQMDIHYVSRTYLTRHGAGPLPGENSEMVFEDDTNHKTRYQGQLRFAHLNQKQLIERCGLDACGLPFKLCLTHCDQLPTDQQADYYSTGPCRNNIEAVTMAVV